MAVKTYNPKEVTISLGSHIVTGYADDSFVTIEPNGDGVTKVVGCDGEVVRALSPDKTYNVKISLLQISDTNTFLQEQLNQDVENGEGMFAILIKDLKGGLVFSAEECWATKAPSRVRGKEQNNNEWELATGEATLTE